MPYQMSAGNTAAASNAATHGTKRLTLVALEAPDTPSSVVAGASALAPGCGFVAGAPAAGPSAVGAGLAAGGSVAALVESACCFARSALIESSSAELAGSVASNSRAWRASSCSSALSG